MRDLRNLALLVLLAGLGAAGVVILRLQAKADDWESRARNAETKVASLRSTIAKSAERPPASRSTANNAAQPDATVAGKSTRNPADPREMLAAAGSDAGKADERLDRWIAAANHPDVVRRLEEMARLQTMRAYGAFIDQLGLPPDQRDQLIKLLAAKREVPLDVAVADLENGVDPRTDLPGYHDMIAATRKDLESQIHDLLGDANYSAYQNYGRTAAQGQVLNNVGQMMNAMQAPLTPEQQTRLLGSLQAGNTARITAKVINDAREYMTPAQLQMLQDFRALQRANIQRRNSPPPSIPKAPGGN